MLPFKNELQFPELDNFSVYSDDYTFNKDGGIETNIQWINSLVREFSHFDIISHKTIEINISEVNNPNLNLKIKLKLKKEENLSSNKNIDIIYEGEHNLHIKIYKNKKNEYLEGSNEKNNDEYSFSDEYSNSEQEESSDMMKNSPIIEDHSSIINLKDDKDSFSCAASDDESDIED